MSETARATAADGDAELIVERVSHVMRLTLNRPHVLNAISPSVATSIGEALESADRDPEIRVVVISGAGDSFSAGVDLKALAAGGFNNLDARVSSWGFAGYVAHPISKPTIAAVKGYALGGATEIVLASDLAIASTTAVLGLPEVQRGVMPGGGGAMRLPLQVPVKIAMEAILTGNQIPAERALHWGLVNRVVAPENLMDETMRLANDIANNAPLAVQASKRVAQRIVGDVIPTEREQWALNERELQKLMQSDDVHEGLTAFAERRTPIWHGR